MKGILIKRNDTWFVQYNPYGQGNIDNNLNLVITKPVLPNTITDDLFVNKEVEFRHADKEYVYIIQKSLDWKEIQNMYSKAAYEQINSGKHDLLCFFDWLEENFNPPSKKY